jgi:hypothetical protein
MLEIITPTMWATFAAYATWYLTSAKDYAPLTSKEAEMLWKIHRQDANCNAKKWRIIKYKGKIVGFECECGHKHEQKRPIAINQPKLN